MSDVPDITHQIYIKPVFDDLQTHFMFDILKTATSFYNRYFYSQTGVESSRWLHSQIAQIIDTSPVSTYISLEYHTHRFPQSSIIARFEPSVRNASLPLTIIVSGNCVEEIRVS